MDRPTPTSPPQRDAGGKRFGTFGGVFTPSILTILGVVLYLRLGWVVGNAGLTRALVIVGVAHLITIATGLSISTIATNRTIGAGGAYYMISRSLGAPTGAAIGLPLFFGQALSVTFYVQGFTESVRSLLPWVPFRPVAVVLCLALALVSIRSAELAIKVQYVVMALIGLSLVSVFAGRGDALPEAIAWAAPEGGAGFAAVFAVFFPAVTGIMAGVGMSGDLKNPRRSIPLGTLLAVGTGLAIYVSLPVWLAMNAAPAELMSDSHVVWSIARVPALVYVGVWGATLSSAIGSFLIAPRTLQALARDGLAPRLLGRGHGPHDEPRTGTVITLLMALGGLWIGDLNAIANVLTMFFLATYGLTNLACGLERWAASPSFRPQFKVPFWVSLGGALGCFYVMSIIDFTAMLAALAICGLIYAVAQRRALGTAYGDARHGIWSALVRTSLHRLRRAEFHPQNWRPNLVIMGGDVDRRSHLLELGSTIVQDQGVVTYFHLLEGAIEDHAEAQRRLQRENDERIAREYPNVFYRCQIVDDVHRGIVTTAQTYGLGSFVANTVLLGWPHKADRWARSARMLSDLVSLDRSLLLVRYDAQRKLGWYRRVDIYWGGLHGNGGLMLLLAFLITSHERWRGARVFLNVVVGSPGERAAAEAAVRRVLAGSRVAATPRVIAREGRSIDAIMKVESEHADLAILGTLLPDPRDPAPYFERMEAMLAGLPTTLLVHSARAFQGEPVLFSSAEP